MKVIAVLLLAFLTIGIFTRRYNKWARIALLAVIVVIVSYETFLS